MGKNRKNKASKNEKRKEKSFECAQELCPNNDNNDVQQDDCCDCE